MHIDNPNEALEKLKKVEKLQSRPTTPAVTPAPQTESLGVQWGSPEVHWGKPTPARIEYISLEEYVGRLRGNPIVHKIDVLYDDSPNEVSIRIEYLHNMHKLDSTILHGAEMELNHTTEHYRIRGCKQIILSIVMKEVIK